MVTAVHFENGTLRVRERVRGFSIVEGKPIRTEFEVETVTRDRDEILDFFANTAVRAISRRSR